MSQPARLAPKPIESMLARAGNSNSNHPNMNTPHPLLPPEWNALAEDMAQLSGINLDTAALLMLLGYDVASGNTIQVRTTEWRDLGASFNLALTSTGAPTPRGALMQFLGPVPDLVKVSSDQLKDAGLGMVALKASLDQLREELREAAGILAKAEAELDDAKKDEARMAGPIGAYYRTRFSTESSGSIQPRVTAARKRHEEIEGKYDMLIFKLRSGILADEPDWRELPKAAENSLDESVLAMCFAKGPADILTLSAKHRTACSETLNRHRIDTRAVTAVTCGPELAYAGVLSQKPIRQSGILAGFLFLDVAHEAPAYSSELKETAALAKWHGLINERWYRRIAWQNRTCDLYRPDAKGIATLVEFRKWVEREQGFSPDIASHLSFLADMTLRLALSRASMSNASGDLIIPHEQVEQAVEFMRRIGRRHREILDRITVEQTEEEVIEQQLGRVVAKIERRGPVTKRGLARCFHDQDYGSLEPLIDLGVSRGKIRKDGNLFSVPPVSVSASA